MITDDDLDRQLRAADTARSFAASEQTLDVLLRSTGRTAGEAPRRRRRRRAVTGFGIAGIVILGGAFAAPAAADAFRFLAQIDWRCAYGTECGDPASEWIDTSAADLPDYVASVFPTAIPFAAPLTEESAVATVTGMLSSNPGTTSEVSVQRLFEQTAYCSWVDQWLTSDSSGDLAAREQATQVMRESVEWPALVATDGGGIMDMQAGFASYAESGDRDGVQAAAQMNLCSQWDGTARDAIIQELLK